MAEADAIERVDEPVTVDSLAADLHEFGITAGDTVIVHTSMSALGWVCGGPPAVVDAFQDVLTTAGTLVMPTHTAQYTDPAEWENPPIPEGWPERIRKTIPPYRPAVTPTRDVGAVPECFRTYPDVHRSRHPHYSFAAWGADADVIVAEHAFDHGLGENSPLADLYDHDADVLLLGTDHGVNTSLHLAEYRADLDIETTVYGAPVERDGERVWVECENLRVDASDFADLGADFERAVGSRTGTVGAADARLADQPTLVEFAVGWLERNR